MNWQDFNNEPTEDLIQYIKWKTDPDYKEAAQAAFHAFCFRFGDDLAKKVEIICNRWGYDKHVAAEIANNVFSRFWKYPNYDHSKSKKKDIGTGVRFYLYAIAERELTNYYYKEQGIIASPYDGSEEIIYDFPEIDFSDYIPEKRKELEQKFEIIKMALERLGEKHKVIYLTYQAHEHPGHKLPRHLLQALRNELELAQATVRYYKNEAQQKINDYLKIYGSK